MVTLGGIIAVFAIIVISILIPGASLALYWDIPSVMIVVVGSFASLFSAFPLDIVLKVGTYFKVAMRKDDTDYKELISNILTLAEGARKEGLLSLEDKMADLQEPFLKKGIQMAVDGVDEEIIVKTLAIETSQLTQRHLKGQLLYEKWGDAAPAFGMIGTLIGLIIMLANMTDKNMIGKGMAAALITTLYGAIMAYGVLSPVNKKLEILHEQEMVKYDMITEGILAIVHGENNSLLKEKLLNFLSPADRAKMSEVSDD